MNEEEREKESRREKGLQDKNSQFMIERENQRLSDSQEERKGERREETKKGGIEGGRTIRSSEIQLRHGDI